MNSRENTIQKLTIAIAGVSEDGSFYGTIPKEVREEINFDELIEDTDNIRGQVEIMFEE